MPTPADYKAMSCYAVVTQAGADVLARRHANAIEMNAPPDALYYSYGKERWITLADLADDYPIKVKVLKLMEGL